MKYVRPFTTSAIQIGDSGPLLLNPEEDFGCSIRVSRGGAPAAVRSGAAVERYALVIQGEVQLVADGQTSTAKAGELVFVPTGTNASISGDDTTFWFEIEAPLVGEPQAINDLRPVVIPVDPSRFEGKGFAYQSLIDRSAGARALRMNVMQIAPGSGSPDYHIHAFAQIYLILEGEMTIDIGKARTVARENSIVVLPQGVVHRNFNASGRIERHVSLLVPEPAVGDVFDFAVDIHDKEAELLTACPE